MSPKILSHAGNNSNNEDLRLDTSSLTAVILFLTSSKSVGDSALDVPVLSYNSPVDLF